MPVTVARPAEFGYTVPDVVEFCEALPRTSSGKHDQARLAGHGS